jgi:hypothetical protein
MLYAGGKYTCYDLKIENILVTNKTLEKVLKCKLAKWNISKIKLA